MSFKVGFKTDLTNTLRHYIFALFMCFLCDDNSDLFRHYVWRVLLSDRDVVVVVVVVYFASYSSEIHKLKTDLNSLNMSSNQQINIFVSFLVFVFLGICLCLWVSIFRKKKTTV